MPRRYRPPTRRRKPKKQSLLEETAALAYKDVGPPAPSLAPVAAQVAVPRERPSQVRHIVRDHSYVMGDLRRVAIIVAFIIAGLLITAVLR